MIILRFILVLFRPGSNAEDSDDNPINEDSGSDLDSDNSSDSDSDNSFDSEKIIRIQLEDSLGNLKEIIIKYK